MLKYHGGTKLLHFNLYFPWLVKSIFPVDIPIRCTVALGCLNPIRCTVGPALSKRRLHPHHTSRQALPL